MRSTVNAQSPRDSQQPSEAESTALIPCLATEEQIEAKSQESSKIKSVVMDGPKRSTCRGAMRKYGSVNAGEEGIEGDGASMDGA